MIGVISLFSGLCFTHGQTLTNLTSDDVDVIASLATSQQVGSDNGVAIFASVIDADMTFTSDKNYIIKDTLFVTNGAKLTIEAGTRIFGASFENNGAITSDNKLGSIVVTRGAQIDVLGEAKNPVLMTTVDTLEAERGLDIDGVDSSGFAHQGAAVPATAPTRETAGRWGGLVVLGNAFVSNFTDTDTTPNNGGEVNLHEKSIEGFAAVGFDNNDGDNFSDIIEYGNSANSDPGTLAINNAESSGTIRYLSIRHGGFALSDGNEINGLTLGGVGSGTTIEFVEVVSNEDDGVEFFGGTVNTNNLVVSFTKDDAFDIDNGHSGTHQFWFVIYDDTDGDHAGEWDGTEVNGDPGTTRYDGIGNSNPFIANATFLDGGSSSTEAFRFDDRFDGLLVDSAIGDFGVDETYDNRSDGVGANLLVTNNVFAGNNNESPSFAANVYSTGLDLAGTSVAVPNGGLDPRPLPTSPLLSGDSDFSQNPFLQDVDYRGAFAPDAPLWLECWTFLDEAGYLPAAPGSLGIVDCGFDQFGDFFIELAVAAAGSTVSASTDLSAFTPLTGGVSVNANTITIDLDGLTPASFLGQDKIFFQVSQ